MGRYFVEDAMLMKNINENRCLTKVILAYSLEEGKYG